jgi:hypothetical protein
MGVSVRLLQIWAAKFLVFASNFIGFLRSQIFISGSLLHRKNSNFDE